jgi:hypothetical protein
MMAGTLLSLSAISQQSWDAKKNPTVDSITSRYTAKYIAPRPALTTTDIFPVIGRYESNAGSEAGAVNVVLDETNKGVVWIEGLPQGRVKAMLRKSPAIYKIPAQKNSEGKDIPEGTLVFEKETNTLNIAIGKEYNVADPLSVFAATPVVEEEATKTKVSKTKLKKPVTPKVWKYSGVKITDDTASN